MSDYFLQDDNVRTDGFTDADAMIRANGQAEAEETSILRSTAAEYRREIEELKNLNRENNKTVEELRRQNAEMLSKMNDTLAAASGGLAEASRRVAENAKEVKSIDLSGISGDVQGAVADAEKKTASLLYETETKLLGQLNETQERIADLIQQSDDFSHKENVRVYRNIQAATDHLLQKQTDELRAGMEPAKAPGKGQKANGVQIAALLVAILTFLYVVCDSLGLVQIALHMLRG